MELDLHGQIKKRKGWQKVILLTIQGYFDNKVGRNAAAMTYYLLFAMFPFFIFVTSLLGLLHLPTLTLDGQITRFLPEDVVAFLNLAIEHITKSSNNALLTFGLVFSVWFPLRAVSNLMEAINDIYGEEKSGSHSIRTAILTALTIVLTPAMLLLLLLGERVLGFVGEYIPISAEFITGWSRMRFVPMAAALLFMLSAVYFFSPSKIQKVRYILPGAVLSMGVWMFFSLIFSYYVDHMGRYSIIYGSIGVIIALLVWMDWSMIAMLMGAVFNVALKETYDKPKEMEIEIKI
ncbi:YihY/virulence factor BrkB family protein [Anaerotignum lactatifermentans]|uniref:Membrane protein n=1 Tax=Anaerotignum lactatifermentans DSM 14214 TaxID=1121323 RepID=A0A1M6UJ82_9FIRM|nr:YihY/virulence factor BrkB family protein [Anaerotignum lactatifermentans]SHK69241.1 membrane protein [[Clostridium] lactatifermentans DSM 14214] [Anaerotignum lactatifermentans DSM 14214]